LLFVELFLCNWQLGNTIHIHYPRIYLFRDSYTWTQQVPYH